MVTQVRQDIQTTVAFLTTRIKTLDKDDWGKLKQALKYLNETKYLKLKLRVDDLGLLKWYIEGSHNVHWDCKWHGGVMFMLGKGATSSYLQKIKLITQRSTKTDLATADMYARNAVFAVLH